MDMWAVLSWSRYHYMWYPLDAVQECEVVGVFPDERSAVESALDLAIGYREGEGLSPAGSLCFIGNTVATRVVRI